MPLSRRVRSVTLRPVNGYQGLLFGMVFNVILILVLLPDNVAPGTLDDERQVHRRPLDLRD